MRTAPLCFILIPFTLLLFVACTDPKPVGPEPEPEYQYEFLRDYEYQDGRIYDVIYSEADQPHAGYVGMGDFDEIWVVRVFETVSIPNYQSMPARFTVDPTVDPGLPFQSPIQGLVNEVPSAEFTVCSDYANNRFYLVFDEARRPLRSTMGVYMEIIRQDSPSGPVLGIDSIGSLETLTLELMLVDPEGPRDPDHPTYPLTWRNVYRIPRGVTADDLAVRVLKGLPGSEGTASATAYQYGFVDSTAYMEVLGLDQYTLASGEKLPDGLMDDRAEVFRPDWGLIIFPHRRPFAADTTFVHADGRHTPPLEDRVPQLYEYNSINEKVQSSKYFIELAIRVD